MDIALLCFNDQEEVVFAGAQRPLWIIRNKELFETKGNKFSIGGTQPANEKIFVEHTIRLQTGDLLYICSDGYADQFNDADKKLMSKRFKEILLNIHHLSMPEQEKYLEEFIEKWKGNFEQTDDILVIGIRI